MTTYSRRVLLLVLLMLFGFLSNRRIRVWQSDYTLWSDTAVSSPAKPRPAVNLASIRDDATALLSARDLAFARRSIFEGRMAYRVASYHLGRLAAVRQDPVSARRYFEDMNRDLRQY